jgi:hypothetical protein
METCGSIADKICIIERRIRVYNEEGKNVEPLYEQYGWLLKELGETLVANFSGKRPFTFKKNKMYDQDVEINEGLSLLQALDSLNDCTNKLWDLEDKRRDKSLPDSDRLAWADLVSINNKARNDSIDRIDEAIQRAARNSHPERFVRGHKQRPALLLEESDE